MFICHLRPTVGRGLSMVNFLCHNLHSFRANITTHLSCNNLHRLVIWLLSTIIPVSQWVRSPGLSSGSFVPLLHIKTEKPMKTNVRVTLVNQSACCGLGQVTRSTHFSNFCHTFRQRPATIIQLAAACSFCLKSLNPRQPSMFQSYSLTQTSTRRRSASWSSSSTVKIVDRHRNTVSLLPSKVTTSASTSSFTILATTLAPLMLPPICSMYTPGSGMLNMRSCASQTTWGYLYYSHNLKSFFGCRELRTTLISSAWFSGLFHRHLVNQLKLSKVYQARAGGREFKAAGDIRPVVGDDQTVEDLGHLLSLLPSLLPPPPLFVDHSQGSRLL